MAQSTIPETARPDRDAGLASWGQADIPPFGLRLSAIKFSDPYTERFAPFSFGPGKQARCDGRRHFEGGQ
jgi:hypothetical protein